MAAHGPDEDRRLRRVVALAAAVPDSRARGPARDVVRAAVVTGGGTGIGAAAARLLGANGCAVVLVGRREETLRAVASELDAAEVVVADLGERDAPRRVVEAAV